MLDSRLAADELDRRALALGTAREQRRPIDPLTDALPELAIDDAYAIAQRGVTARIAGGARLVGHKIGLTSVAVQQQLGVTEPDYGALLDVMEIDSGATIELVDSRVADWRIRLADTVADNASSAGFVLGGRRRPLGELDVSAVVVELWRGGEVVERGTSSAVLGDPCAAVAWLANALAPFGAALEAGQVVLSGACTRMVAVLPGDDFRGTFGGLGEVRLTVAGPDR